MKRIKIVASIIVLSLFALFIVTSIISDNPQNEAIPELRPNEWMLMQRMYPHEKINPEAYDQSRKQAIEIRQDAKRYKSGQEDWELVGPYNVGGRVTDVEMHSSDTETIYITAASGGIFKSQDKGLSWNQIFENSFTQSIGDMHIAETDKNILYVGTGEPNGGQGSITYDGYGVFKSTDAGATWSQSGLINAGGIGRVEVDPTNADRVFVAAMGNLFSPNPQRGVYRTTDGGQTWENVLFLNDSTGAIDLCINPNDPNIVYAAMWERVRGPYHRTYGGPSSGLYKTTDGGETWEQLTSGLPSGSQGRIAIDISKSHPDILYCTYSAMKDKDYGFGGIFKTTDGGINWEEMDANINGSIYSWWFSKVQVHPKNPDIVWVSEFNMYHYDVEDQNWKTVGGIHVDQHAVYIHPRETNFVVIGNDGGVYTSDNEGKDFTFVTNLPITQFYTCEANYQNPNQRYGGTQDNGTIRTMTGETGDWHRIYGGDGFIVRVDPSDSRYMYAASQRGGFGRSTNSGSSFMGARPDYSVTYNWKTPYILDPNTPSTVYLGGQSVYKSTNRAASWTKISDDLTNRNPGLWNYATLTALAASAVDDKIIWAGTDDGNVWVTSNGGSGKEWTKVSDNLPVRWVTTVATDPFDAHTAYVGFSGLRYFDYEPHLFRTTDLGVTWEDISGNLPDMPLNIVIIDPDNQGTFYIACDNGVYVSYDAGTIWEPLGNGLPTVPVLDLNLHRPTRTLLAATFGRSQYLIKVKASSGTSEIENPMNGLTVYPNPSIDIMNIDFYLEMAQKGKLLIYNMTGQVVNTLKEGSFIQGDHSYTWDGSQDGQNRIPGIYICRLVTDKQIISKRIIVQ